MRPVVDVRLWHKADITIVLINGPLSGVKRTSTGLSEMSASDPKRTSVGLVGGTVGSAMRRDDSAPHLNK